MPEDIFIKDLKKSPASSLEEVKEVKEKKPKRKLTQKQLDALAKGRSKREEKRKQKKLNDNLEQKAVVEKKEQYQTKKKILKEQEILEKIRIREKELKKNLKLDNWKEKRIKALILCQTEEQYHKVSDYLDKFTDEDIMSEEGIIKKYDSLFKNGSSTNL